jgi:hypothetical protein
MHDLIERPGGPCQKKGGGEGGEGVKNMEYPILLARVLFMRFLIW